MPRGLSSAFKAAVGQPVIYPALFVEFDFDTGKARFWTGEAPIIWDGETWAGGGLLGELRVAGESQQIESRQLQFILNGVDPSFYSVAANTPYRGRPVRIWFALMDPGTGGVAHSTLLESARMDVMQIMSTDDAITISLECERRIVDLFRANSVFATPSDYARIDPATTFYEFVPRLQDMELPWGMQSGMHRARTGGKFDFGGTTWVRG